VSDGRRLLVTFLAEDWRDAVRGRLLGDRRVGIDVRANRAPRELSVDCYELVVRSSDHTLLRESLVEVARDAGVDLASSERVCIGAPSISS